MKKMSNRQKWTEYNAKNALNRLDYAIQTAKDLGDGLVKEKPEIMISVSESTMVISKSQARKYIKDAFHSMDRSHMREADFVASAQSTFTITLSYGTVWVKAYLETTRTEENNRKHAMLKVTRDEIFGNDEEEE